MAAWGDNPGRFAHAEKVSRLFPACKPFRRPEGRSKACSTRDQPQANAVVTTQVGVRLRQGPVVAFVDPERPWTASRFDAIKRHDGQIQLQQKLSRRGWGKRDQGAEALDAGAEADDGTAGGLAAFSKVLISALATPRSMITCCLSALISFGSLARAQNRGSPLSRVRRGGIR